MASKKQLIEDLKKEYDCENWRKVDYYERDFHKHLFKKVVPHLSQTGIIELTNWFKDLNENGKDQEEYI
ncbi:hypothetical protein [uncultured Clostridium sp.]|uniref:hypothetical protein n=1 Tax=uncultured Clostridium sp. TaxID=59620 RepID=UPI003216405A